MCEMLVRVVSKVNADPYLDAKCTKRGDVIVVAPDGWVWGVEELTNPDWRILRVPGVTVEQAQAFIQPELDEDPARPSKVLQRRAFRLDIDHPRFAPMLGSRKGKPKHRDDMPLADLLALKQRKPRLQDPNVLD